MTITIELAEEAYQKYIDSGYKSRPIEEFWNELDNQRL